MCAKGRANLLMSREFDSKNRVESGTQHPDFHWWTEM
jgi:hypothetical protein